MSIVKLEEVYLYTTLDHTHTACYELKKWLDDNNIQYTNLYYHAHEVENVFTPLNTWWEGVTFTEFPILIYTELRDDTPLSLSPRRYAKGLNTLNKEEFLQYAPRKV